LSAALLFYDYFLTLEWEVSRYWAVPFKWPDLLFFLNRYGALLGNIPVIVYLWIMPRCLTVPCRCSPLETYHLYFIFANQILVAVILILRTYAIYARNNRVLGFIMVVVAGVIGVGVVSLIFTLCSSCRLFQCENVPLYTGCISPVSRSEGLHLIGPWAGMATFDSTIFVLTLYRALSQHNRHGRSLLSVLLRDGAHQFSAMDLC
ncbi:hypothetical protein FB451DRAFT_1047343, partial [Mycena latifolia]